MYASRYIHILWSCSKLTVLATSHIQERVLSLSLSLLSSGSSSSPSSALVGTTGSTSVKIQGSLFFYEQRLPHIERDFTSCPNKIVKGLKYHRSAESSTTLFSEERSLELTLPNCSDISLEVWSILCFSLKFFCPESIFLLIFRLTSVGE